MIDSPVKKTSFCVVGDSSNSKKCIYRLADIEDGVLEIPIIDEDAPKIFDNRTRLYWRNGPSEDGMFGVWDWSAVPSKKNPDSDYIETDYAESMQVVEVIEIRKVETVKELVNMLSAGVPVLHVSPKVFFCFRNSQRTLKGVLCAGPEINISDGQTIISDGTQSLPVYEINLQDTISLDGKTFYRRLFFEGPEKRILVKEPVDIVRNIIIKRTTWSAVKPLGVTKKTWRSIRELIKETPADTIYQEVASACNCDEKEAVAYVHSFIDNVEDYISQDSYDNKVIISILEGHPALMQKCESIVSERWSSTHKAEIENAKKELDAIVADTEKKKSELDAYSEKITSSEKRLVQLTKGIDEQKKLADDVSKKVKNKIAEAKSDAASFIAEMAFVSSPGSGIRVDTPAKQLQTLCNGDELNPETVETSGDWKDAIETLRLELTEAGVAEKHSTGLASLLYAAFIDHVPILLAGPNGNSIADAFSAALFGRTAGKLDCSTLYHPAISEEIDESTSAVITISNALRNDWVANLPELLTANKFFFITHPFSEDLLIEPRSLFSYAMPIFTELLIDHMPTGCFVGAKKSPDYKEYHSKKAESFYDKMLKSFGCGMLARSKIQAVLTDFHELMGFENVDLDCLYAVFPYAFVTCPSHAEMIERISNEMKISGDLINELKNYIGIGDE